MEIVLFDDEQCKHLHPLTATRPAGDIRCGIFTPAERWQHFISNVSISWHTQDYLQTKFKPLNSDEAIWINGRAIPSATGLDKIINLQLGEALVLNDTLIAFYGEKKSFEQSTYSNKTSISAKDFLLINFPEDIFSLNADVTEIDFSWVAENKQSQPLPDYVTCLGHDVFIEEGAALNPCILNSETGPIYIGKDAEIMEGCMVRGPFVMNEHAVLKMGAKIYGATTLGPYVKAGGEINNSVICGYSNKGHDGFLGNSVIGQWCNLGADTNNSNLKNNYAEVKLWDESMGRFRNTGLQFCGLIMGDHSKCGINTMFNTGTVVGVSSNIFGSGFPRNTVPSFAWGGSSGFTTFQLKKAFEVAERVMKRRSLEFNQTEQNILTHLFESSQTSRWWEK